MKIFKDNIWAQKLVVYFKIYLNQHMIIKKILTKKVKKQKRVRCF